MLNSSLIAFAPDGPAPNECVACSHCGTALLPDQRGPAPRFCCSGCRTVFELLQTSGLTDYYGFRERVGAEGRSLAETSLPDELRELDSPAFHELFCRDLDAETATVELSLAGLHCAACVWLIERVPRLEPSVREARVDWARGTVRLNFERRGAPLSQIAQTIASLGYEPRPYRAGRAEAERRKELRSLLLRIGVAGAIAGNVMLMAFALYSGETGTMDVATRRFFELSSFALSLPSLWAAGLFFRGALASLRTRSPHMDLPIAVGISAGYAMGTYGALTGRGELYFDSLTVLIFLLLVGRYLNRRHQLSAAAAAELVSSVAPSTARRVTESEETETAYVGDLKPGDLVEVRSGETVCVDGEVVSGESSLDLSLMSGESVPVAVGPGAKVQAGSSNVGGVLRIRTERAGAETRVAELMREVERAMSGRSPLVADADKVAGVFTWGIILVAVLVAAVWWSIDASRALPNALALLIVACPCALAMATPLALSAASGQAAREKILFFGVSAMERLARPCDVILDKTGTLTEGRWSVSAWTGDESYRAVLGVAEEVSTHPVARALAAAFVPSPAEAGALRADLSDVSEVAGGGIKAIFRGELLLIGSEAFVRETASLPEELAVALSLAPARVSPLFVAHGGLIRAVVFLEDRVRPGALSALLSLKENGHRLHLLSGDHPKTVAALAEELTREAGKPELFTSVAGGQRPLDKLRAVRGRLDQGREVVMVGDGVNDAAALAASNVGISVHGAAEASRLSADVFLGGGGAARLAELFEGSRRALRTIRRGMAFSLAYNVVGVTLAMMGELSPLWAAILMPVSSLTVVSNAYRSRMFGSNVPRVPSAKLERSAPERRSA